MALLKRELYRQVEGPEVTHADCCTLVFDTDTKSLYVERQVAHLDSRVDGTIEMQTPEWILRITSSKSAKLLGTANYGGC